MSLDNNSITLIIPCYNEQNNIENTINEVNLALNNSIMQQYEIIIVDDASNDNTFKIANSLQKKNKNIKVIRNTMNLGVGGAIKKGLSNAKLDKVMFIPGDNCHKNSEIKKLINIKNDYDLVLTFYSNPEIRSFLRTVFTKLYTPFLNFIFGLNLPYYNGLAVYKKSILKDINIYTNSFTWQIETLLKLFKTKNIKYTIIPTLLDDRIDGKSKAFSLKNSFYVFFSILRLFFLKFFLIKKK